jgi:hypothetical protein
MHRTFGLATRNLIYTSVALIISVILVILFTRENVRNSRVRLNPPTSIQGSNLFRVVTYTGNAFVNRNGKMVIDPRPWLLSSFEDEMAVVQIDEKFGFMDVTGNLKIPAEYSLASHFKSGWALVRKGSEHFVIDKSNNVVRSLTDVCDDIRQFSDGLAAASKDSLWGFVDTNFVFVIPPKFSEVDDFSEGFAAAKLGEMWGAVNRKGETAVSPAFNHLSRFHEGRARAILKGKIGYVNTNGLMAIEPIYEDGGEFFGGVAPVRTGGKWGSVDVQGTERIPFRFSAAEEFTCELAPARIGLKFGYINTNGIFAIEPRFETALPFERGLAQVTLHRKILGRFAYIDTTGAEVWHD